MENGRVSQRLSALVVAAGLTLVYPFLSAVGAVSFVLGIPVLYLFLFVAWAAFIALVGAAMWWEQRASNRQEKRR